MLVLARRLTTTVIAPLFLAACGGKVESDGSMDRFHREDGAGIGKTSNQDSGSSEDWREDGTGATGASGGSPSSSGGAPHSSGGGAATGGAPATGGTAATGGATGSTGGASGSSGGGASPPGEPTLLCNYLERSPPGLTEMCDASLGAPCAQAPDAYLKPLVVAGDQDFGWDAAVSGDTMVVAAKDAAIIGTSEDGSDQVHSSGGAVHVFVRHEGNWVQQAQLEPWEAAEYHNFGWAVAIWGDTIAVTDSGSDSAYVFVRRGTSWLPQAHLRPENAQGAFGYSLAVWEDTLIVGDPSDDTSSAGGGADEPAGVASNSGAAYIFSRTGEEWSQDAYLKAASPDAEDRFGYRVAVSEDTVVVGAEREDSAATGANGDDSDNSGIDRGAAYVFRNTTGAWIQEAYLKPSVHGDGDRFGSSVAISGDTIAVSADGEDSAATGINGDVNNGDAVGSGAVYIFDRQATTWTQAAYIKSSNTDAQDEFGYDVALSGNGLVVGARGEASTATGVNGDATNNDAQARGAAYVFHRSHGVWAESAYLKPAEGEVYLNGNRPTISWGRSVSVDGGVVVVGSSSAELVLQGVGTSPAFFSTTGAAHVFEQADQNWALASTLNPHAGSLVSNSVGGSPLWSTLGLGTRIAMSGNTLVSGSYKAQTWHVYVKEAQGWTPQAWLAPTSDVDDVMTFDEVVAIQGDRIAVQVRAGEWGAKKRVLLFERNQGVWSQGQALESSNNARYDEFGSAIAFGEDYIVVGAPEEESAATGVNGDATDDSLPRAGAAYVFELVDGTWQQTAYLKPSVVDPEGRFGNYIVAEKNVIVVASNSRMTTFVRRNGQWSEEHVIPAGADNLAMYGDTLAAALDSVGVDIYRWKGCGWELEAHVESDVSSGSLTDSLSLAGDVLAVGHLGDSFEEATYAGSVSLYVRDPQTLTWSQTGYLQSPAPEAQDYFGGAVALDGGNLAIAAQGDDGTGLGLGVDVQSDWGIGSGAIFAWKIANNASFR